MREMKSRKRNQIFACFLRMLLQEGLSQKEMTQNKIGMDSKSVKRERDIGRENENENTMDRRRETDQLRIDQD